MELSVPVCLDSLQVAFVEITDQPDHDDRFLDVPLDMLMPASDQERASPAPPSHSAVADEPEPSVKGLSLPCRRTVLSNNRDLLCIPAPGQDTAEEGMYVMVCVD